MRFDFEITHVPGKELYTADVLSRAPVGQMDVCPDDCYGSPNIRTAVKIRIQNALNWKSCVEKGNLPGTRCEEH